MIIIVANFISEWLKEIVVLFIIISLVDLLMPKGKMKRYVNFIMGIIIIFTVISPFSKLNMFTLNIDKEVERITQNLVSESSAFEDQNRQIERLYKENISNEITRLIEENSEHKVKNTEIYLSEDLYMIDKVNITLINDSSSNQNMVKVDKIKVGDASPVFNENDDYKNLKILIANYLNLDIKNLTINKED